jgi:hypothetical protein
MINGTQVNVEELVNFLRNRTGITGLNLCMVEIGAEGAREFVKLKDLGLDLSGNNISDQCVSELANSIKGFSFVAKRSSLQTEPKTGIRHYIGSGVAILVGIAYLAGATTLTPVGAVAVFLAAAAVGALVGYGIGKFCEKVSEEKQKDSDISTSSTAVNSRLTPQPFESQSKT